MQLIRALLIAAIIVVVLSGISIFFGSRKQEKRISIYFLIATIGAALWTAAITVALRMPGASPEFVSISWLEIQGWQACHIHFCSHRNFARCRARF